MCPPIKRFVGRISRRPLLNTCPLFGDEDLCRKNQMPTPAMRYPARAPPPHAMAFKRSTRTLMHYFMAPAIGRGLHARIPRLDVRVLELQLECIPVLPDHLAEWQHVWHPFDEAALLVERCHLRRAEHEPSQRAIDPSERGMDTSAAGPLKTPKLAPPASTNMP